MDILGSVAALGVSHQLLPTVHILWWQHPSSVGCHRRGTLLRVLSGLEARSPHNCPVRVPAGLSQAVPTQFCVPVALRVEWACPTWCLLCRFVVRSAPRECSLRDPIPEAHMSALSPTPRAQLGGFGQVSLPVCIPVSAFVKCQSIESCFPGLPPQLFLSADQKEMAAESFVHRKTLGSVREGSVTWDTDSSSLSHLPRAGVTSGNEKQRGAWWTRDSLSGESREHFFQFTLF